MPAQTDLTLERLYASPSLSGPSPRSVRFSPDGTRLTLLRPRADDLSRYDLWQYITQTGELSLLVDSVLLDPEDAVMSEEAKAMRERKRTAGLRGIVDYAWGDERTLLVPAGGDLFLIEVSPASAYLPAAKAPPRAPVVTQVTRTDTFEYDAKISPNGQYVSFIRDGALFAWNRLTGTETRISPAADPAQAISYGVAEFVAQEEMRRYTGYWWGPDSRHIAYTKVDESGVDIVPRFDIEAEKVTVVNQRYPRAGQPNAIVTLILRDMTDGTERVVASFGPDDYLARVDWGHGDLWFQAMNRAQTELHYNRAAGPDWNVRLTFTEENKRWVNLSDDFLPLPDGNVVVTSEEDGFRQLYWRSPETGEQRQITFGNAPVARILGYDDQSRRIYFEGYLDTPLERHLYSVSMGWTDAEIEEAGAERLPDSACVDLHPRSARLTQVCPEVTRITAEGSTWSSVMSPNSKTFVSTASAPAQPPQTALFNIDGTRLSWIEENALDTAHPYAPYLDAHALPEFGLLAAEDRQTLHYSLLKPPGFDPARRYPVVIDVYGGPHAQTVEHKWGSLSDQYLARQGFLVFRLDNRGSDNRGRRFEDVIHRRTGGPEVRDQLAGVDWLKSQSFVDPDRIAIQGWSYGGYMTLMTVAQAPEGTFAAALAGAPVTDWALYDTFYTERYMGTPEENPEGYEASSVFAHIDGLSRAPLLLMHGMADDNVTFDNTTRLMAELQQRGIVFDLMTYPGQRHGIRGEALQLHLMRTRMAFLNRHLKNGED